MLYELNAEITQGSALLCFKVCTMTVCICGVKALFWSGQFIRISVSQFTEKDWNRQKRNCESRNWIFIVKESRNFENCIKIKSKLEKIMEWVEFVDFKYISIHYTNTIIYVLSNNWNQQIQLIPSFLNLNNMVPLLYKDGIRIFKSLDKSKCGFLPTLRGNHISKSPGKVNVDTFLYRDVSTFAKVRIKWMWIPSYIEMYHICKSRGKMNVDTFLYREESTWMGVKRFGTETSCLPKRLVWS